MKKSIILIICFYIAICPLFCIRDFSFAVSDSSDWLPCDNDTLIQECAKAFLRANNFAWETTPSGQFTAWTYNYLKEQANQHGYTMNELAEGMKYKYIDNNRYYFITKNSIGILQDIYTSMLNNLGIGDDEFKIIYSGKYFEDANGKKVLCFISDPSISSVSNLSIEAVRTDFYNYYLAFGEPYMYTGSELSEMQSVTYNLTSYQTPTYNILNYSSTTTSQYIYTNSYSINSRANMVYCDNVITGYDCIVYDSNHSKYYLASFIDTQATKASGGNYRVIKMGLVTQINSPTAGNAEVKANQGPIVNIFNTNNNYVITINNNDPDNPTVQPVDEPPEQKPVPPDTTVPVDNPTNDTGVSIGDDGSINFKLPKLNIDWNLGLDVENLPFPFSIPFDFNNALKMLDVEPETPRFQGTITIPYIDYDWEIDIDFGKYDEYETLINMFQKVFLFGYVISLILATRAVMHIY